MKKLFVFVAVFFVLGGYFLSAQDLIILRNGNMIEAVVVEISPTEIRYRRLDLLDGPIFVIPVANVLSVRLESGLVEVFDHPTQPIPPTQITTMDSGLLNRWVYLGGIFGHGIFDYSNTRGHHFGPGFIADFALMRFFSIGVGVIPMFTSNNPDDYWEWGIGGSGLTPVVPITANFGTLWWRGIYSSVNIGYIIGIGFSFGATVGYRVGSGIFFVRSYQVINARPLAGYSLDRVSLLFMGYKVGVGSERR